MSAKIAAALHNVMTKVGYVQKTGKNAFHGYKYAGEADLLDKLRPAMIEEGLLLLPSITDVSSIDEHGNTFVRVAYTLVHKDGDIWPEKVCAAGCGNDRNKNGVGDKGLYKALTGANKYLLFKLFQIETGDDPEATEAAPRHVDQEPESPPISELLEVQQKHLHKAALKGRQALKEAWEATPSDYKSSLKHHLDNVLKPIAAAQDDIKSVGAA